MKKIFTIMMVVSMIFMNMMGHSYAAEQQSNVRYVTENENEEVKFQQVAAGNNHSLGLSTNGTVYTWGNNAYGQLGNGRISYNSIPSPIMDNVKFIAASRNQSFAITKENDLYAWGDNSYDIFGIETANTQRTPVKIMENVQSVAAGYEHTLILTNNGELYGLGRNTNGALGQGMEVATVREPVKILDNIQKIAAEAKHSMALTKDGVVYHFGKLGDTITVSYEPTIMMENVKDIVCGLTTAFAINNNNELYGWGEDMSYGILLTNTLATEPIKLYDNALFVSAFGQVLFVDMNNNLITWGNNSTGQLGNGSTGKNTIPTNIMENISFVEAQANHSLAISKNGELYAWGSQANGKLGNSMTSGHINIPAKIQVLNVLNPRIKFDNPELILPINTTTPINVTVYNSTTTEATWTSSDPNIATVTDTGELTTVDIGTTEVTMTTGDGITNTCTIIVTEADVSTPELPMLSLLLEVGEVARLSVSQDLGDNNDMIWTSTDGNIAEVDSNGYVTAYSEGIVRIYAENDENSFYINVKVIASGTADEYRLAVDLQVGETARLYLSDSENIIWSSMDESVATIDETGRVTAESEGLAIMQAELDGDTYIIYVRVR